MSIKKVLTTTAVGAFLLGGTAIAMANHTGTGSSATGGNAMSGDATSGAATGGNASTYRGSATGGNAMSGDATSGPATGGDASSYSSKYPDMKYGPKDRDRRKGKRNGKRK